MTDQSDLGGESAGGTCGSCGRAMPAPDLEAVAASIDQTLSLETGKMVARTAWAGPPPDGAMDALLSWLPSVKAKRKVWERGQELWAEQMTLALSGPCEHCRGIDEPMMHGETLVPPTAAAPVYESSTVAIPSGGPLPTPPYEDEEEGQTSAMPAFLEPARDAEDRPTAAASSFGGGFGETPSAESAPTAASAVPPEPPGDEHESHTMILSSLPSLRTTTRLVVLDGPVHGRQFSLGRQTTTIGRSIGCHITVEADAVAYDHARVVRTANGFQIEAIGGVSDLSVNDEPVRDSRTLQNGDVIKVGPARLRYESTGQA